MKSFLFRSGIALSGVLLMLCLLEFPIQLNYSTVNSPIGDWQTLEGQNAQILIVGNSRGWTTYNPEVIEKILGKSTFVLSQDGWNADLMKVKSAYYVSRNSDPEIILLQCDPSMVSERKEWYSKKDFLKYLLFDRINIRTFASNLSGYRWWDFFVPTARYFGSPKRYLQDAIGNYTPLNRRYERFTKNRKHKGFCAYKCIPGFATVIPDNSIWTQEIDSARFESLTKIRELFPSSKVIFTFPPVSHNLFQKLDLIPYQNFAAKFGQELLVHQHDTYFDDDLFYDHTHVNVLGSNKVTDHLIQHITEHALQLP
jgi:hypothetical protein